MDRITRVMVEGNKLLCLKCGKSWTPRVAQPRQCGGCNNRIDWEASGYPFGHPQLVAEMAKKHEAKVAERAQAVNPEPRYTPEPRRRQHIEDSPEYVPPTIVEQQRPPQANPYPPQPQPQQQPHPYPQPQPTPQYRPPADQAPQQYPPQQPPQNYPQHPEYYPPPPTDEVHPASRDDHPADMGALPPNLKFKQNMNPNNMFQDSQKAMAGDQPKNPVGAPGLFQLPDLKPEDLQMIMGLVFAEEDNALRASEAVTDFLNNNKSEIMQRVVGTIGSGMAGQGDPLVSSALLMVGTLGFLKMSENRAETKDLQAQKEELEQLKQQATVVAEAEPEDDGSIFGIEPPKTGRNKEEREMPDLGDEKSKVPDPSEDIFGIEPPAKKTKPVEEEPEEEPKKVYPGFPEDFGPEDEFTDEDVYGGEDIVPPKSIPVSKDDVIGLLSMFTQVPDTLLLMMVKKKVDVVSQFEAQIKDQMGGLDEPTREKIEAVLTMPIEDLQEILEDAYKETGAKQLRTLSEPKARGFLEANLGQVHRILSEGE